MMEIERRKSERLANKGDRVEVYANVENGIVIDVTLTLPDGRLRKDIKISEVAANELLVKLTQVLAEAENAKIRTATP